ncbi:hypothetical protein [Desmospora activa]|uniref:Uncharacterized protein n=1 Tax=Desmospora activa DSM 45169 TaxID=1121389 RepID=A0A2T4Z422_9BACL|nr:hypothetical protein [Desmospora activa]PTM56642.1 hypothetical protein C8J48_2967 [Desmospora activa DSM 45169]
MASLFTFAGILMTIVGGVLALRSKSMGLEILVLGLFCLLIAFLA